MFCRQHIRWLFVFGLAVIMAWASPQVQAGSDAGAVFVAGNTNGPNEVLMYQRASDGALSYVGAFLTGGIGTGAGIFIPEDPLGSQGSLVLSEDHRFLFVVNAGSNDISMFQVNPTGLTLLDKVDSGGPYPVSLAVHQNLLYVLNAGDNGNITGFEVTNQGRLIPLANSTRELDANGSTPPHVFDSPAQIQFSPQGNMLVVHG